MFWRRRRDKGEDEAEAKRGRGRDEQDAGLEAELSADREPADLDEPSGDEELDAAELDRLEGLDEDDDADTGDETEASDPAARREATESGEPAEPGAPEPEDMTADLEAQAREFLADNDVWMYGENAPAVIAVLDRLEELGPYDAELLVDLWQEIPRAEREIARKAMRRVTESDEEAERRTQLVREAVGNWVAVTSDDPKHLADDVAWPRHAAQVAEAAIDAASALILQDELDEADFESLHGPWAEAVEEWDTEATEAGDEESAEAIEAGADEAEDADEEPVREGEFGPNTREVKELLNRLWLLPGEQVSRLVANWEQTDHDELQAAHDALRDLVADEPEYRRQIRRAQEELQPWLNSGRRVETSAYLGRTGSADTHNQAGPALADAVAALVVGDLLDPEDAETLYAPWFKLVGTPKLPEPAPFEDEEPEEGAGDEGSEEPETKPKGSKPGQKPGNAGQKQTATAPMPAGSRPARAKPGALQPSTQQQGTKAGGQVGSKSGGPSTAKAAPKPAPGKPAPGKPVAPQPARPGQRTSIKKGKHRR